MNRNSPGTRSVVRHHASQRLESNGDPAAVAAAAALAAAEATITSQELEILQLGQQLQESERRSVKDFPQDYQPAIMNGSL